MWVDVAGISPGPMECPAGDLFSGQAAHVSPSSSECGTPMIGPGPHAAQTAGDCGPASTPRDVGPLFLCGAAPSSLSASPASLRTVMFPPTSLPRPAFQPLVTVLTSAGGLAVCVRILFIPLSRESGCHAPSASPWGARKLAAPGKLSSRLWTAATFAEARYRLS
jgi:hypothetical protein